MAKGKRGESIQQPINFKMFPPCEELFKVLQRQQESRSHRNSPFHLRLSRSPPPFFSLSIFVFDKVFAVFSAEVYGAERPNDEVDRRYKRMCAFSDINEMILMYAIRTTLKPMESHVTGGWL